MDLTPKEHAVLMRFWNKVQTVHDAADELEISYDSCIKTVRTLMDKGYIKEVGVREGHKRRLTAVTLPENATDIPPDQVRILWDNKVVSIPKAILTLSPTPEVSIRERVFNLIISLEQRGENLKSNSTAGWDAKEIRIAMLRVLGEIRQWEKFIETILQAPVWMDSPHLPEKIGSGGRYDIKARIAAATEYHFMASGKRALELTKDTPAPTAPTNGEEVVL